MIENGVNGILVQCKDLRRSAEWYKQLGFTVGDHDYDHFVDLEINGDYVLHLVKRKNVSPLVEPVVSYDTTDIEGAFYTLKENGVEIAGELNRHSNHIEFSFRDPDENTFLFTKWD